MKLSDLEFKQGVPVVSEPTLFFRRCGAIYACEVHPNGKVLDSRRRVSGNPGADEYAPIPTAPAYLRRIEGVPTEDGEYLAVSKRDSRNRFLVDVVGGYLFNAMTSAKFYALDQYTYFALPPREPEPKPLEDCVVRYLCCDDHYLAKHRGGKIVSIRHVAKIRTGASSASSCPWKATPNEHQSC